MRACIPPTYTGGYLLKYLLIQQMGEQMEPIVSMTTLQRNPSEVKRAAQEGIVRVTEQGAPAYVFCSEAALEDLVAREREDAAYEARLLDAVGRGIADINEGRYTDSVDEAFVRAEQIRAHYA